MQTYDEWKTTPPPEEGERCMHCKEWLDADGFCLCGDAEARAEEREARRADYCDGEEDDDVAF